MSSNGTPSDYGLSAAVTHALGELLPSITQHIMQQLNNAPPPPPPNTPPYVPEPPPYDPESTIRRNAPVGIHVWLERFQKQKPKSFTKATTPIEAKDCISHIEKIFRVLRVENQYKTRLAAYKLEEDAQNWWELILHERGGEQFAETLPWKEFCTLFFDNDFYSGWDSVIITHIYYDCPLRLDNIICKANLFPMQMGEFDVILGMDWLAQHRATIDCYSKRVLFGDFRCPKFVYQGIQPRKSITVISALKAQKLLSHGCQGFIAAIKDTSTDTPRIENFPIVCDFPDVFPEELPGIPPDREVEFTIDLIPGPEPISKAPYKMAPLELKEL
ncbi:hypothetical protein E3N88_28992 [Mikania micrantha]|uniref:Reverse transcriptase domain-containing protein n=1 Tax=Mikania micrantha TaxID=192012 RepID=A0A5N6N1L8_9ASTR|nr:hypothetical protein E3N88_28992 [Mikania micrantha]